MFPSSRLNKFAGGILLTLGAAMALVYSIVADSVLGEQKNSTNETVASATVEGKQSTRVAQRTDVTRPDVDKQNAEKPTLKAYACPPGQTADFAEQLNQEFKQTAGVRIVVDRRTARLLVFAPPRLHERLAKRIDQLVAAGPIAPEIAPKSLNVKLERLAVGQLQGRLLEILGTRLMPVPPTVPGEINHRITLPGGGEIALTLKHRDNTALVEGPAGSVDSLAKMLQGLDTRPATPERDTRMVAVEAARPERIRRAVDAMQFANENAPRGSLVSMLLQQPEGGRATAPGGNGPTDDTPDGAAPNAAPVAPAGLLGPVQIELLEGLDVVVIRGNQRDVEKVTEIIAQIEQLSRETEPIIEIYQLREVDCTSMAKLVTPLYDKVFSPRQGSISITPLVKPNALLLVGRDTSVEAALDLIRRLDQPVLPRTQFRVFSLRHAAAANAQETIEEFFDRSEQDDDEQGLATKVKVTADIRSNSLIVQAAPRDMAEVAEMIAKIDAPRSESYSEVKVFKLENSLAEELAEILQQAISGNLTGRQAGSQQRTNQGSGSGGTSSRQLEQRSAMLKFLAVDKEGSRLLSSGILSDVRITADPRANALLVTAGADSMELIGELIRTMDRLPAAEAQVKVFTIINGDAESLAQMLEALFAQQAGGNEPPVQTAAVEGESSLVTLRFAVDMRTNSIIASGSRGDLQVVEAILLRLDDSDMRDRKSIVYRLRNSPAQYVAQAINEFLRSERQVQQLTPGVLSPFEQIEQEVVVVPETVSNSLIVSATPRFFEEVQALVEQLDQRPPMVMIQVLIAEVKLNETDEFGIELGLQDSVLFDRGLLDDIQTISRTTYNQISGNPTSSTDVIVSADNQPGFAFNNQALGNSGSENSLTTAGIVAAQTLSHFDVGRVNDELGFGGLVLSASSESVSILIRALQECRRLEILSRPQIMTLDNQPAFIQVGQRVPRIVGTQLNEVGQTNNITLENVGLIMGVTPRISPDGLVVMEIDAEKSDVGPEEDGIPVSISEGQVIRSPRINTTTAQTTVSALSGQTVVLGGLITKAKKEANRKVPFFGDLPILGHFFRYDGVAEQRTELLIILTPRIVRNEADMEQIKQVEAARMNWCLRDVMELQGEVGMRCRTDEWHDSETEVIYPDGMPAELVPMPEESFGAMEMVPTPEAESSEPAARGAVSPVPPQSRPLNLEPALPSNPPSTMRIEQPRAMPVDQTPPQVQPPPQSPPQPEPLGTELRIRPTQQSSAWPRTETPAVQQAVYESRYQPQNLYRR